MSSLHTDFRPKNRFESIRKLRKVVPPTFQQEKISTKFFKPNEEVSSLGLTAFSGEWNETKKLHLLKRGTFGVRWSDLSAYESLSFIESIQYFLSSRSDVSIPVNDYQDEAAGLVDQDVALGETWIYAPISSNPDVEGARIISYKSWWVGQIETQPPTIEEKLLLFWYNLLPTEAWGVFIAKASYKYTQMLRAHAFGNFKSLIKALTKDPAMLLYLNGTYNHKDAPDENYARELQELFCVGKGPDSKYTEQDVQAAARVLTGWVVDWNSITTESEAYAGIWEDAHDTSDKVFSSFYNNTMVEGKNGDQLDEELDTFLDMIFDNPETAKYVCRRLYRFFVSNTINDAIESNIIEPLAAIFRNENYEIKPVLETLFSSEHFFDELHTGALIKSPVEFVMGMWRSFEIKYDRADIQYARRMRTGLLWNMSSMGLEIGDAPSVAGWPPYYQEPQLDKAWITTDTIIKRGITGDSLVYWGLWIDEFLQVILDAPAFCQLLSDPSDPNILIQDWEKLFLGVTLSDTKRVGIKSILLSGQSSDYYWTNAWYDFINDPNNSEKRLIVENRLKPAIQVLLQSPENQLF